MQFIQGFFLPIKNGRLRVSQSSAGQLCGHPRRRFCSKCWMGGISRVLWTPSFKILILSPSGQSLASDASSIRGCWKAKGGSSPITGLLSLHALRWIPIVSEECSAQPRHPREVPNLFSSFRFEGAHVLFWAEGRNQTGTEMISTTDICSHPAGFPRNWPELASFILRPK